MADTLEGAQTVVRTGCEQLLLEMVYSVSDGTFEIFFERYCSVDNLFLDNLWILRSRKASAENLGRLVAARLARGNLTVLSSDLTAHDVITTVPAIGRYLDDQRTVRLAI